MKVRILGMNVACDRPLPGVPLAGDSPVDIVVSRGDRPERPSDWTIGSDWPLVATHDDHVVLWFEDDVVFEFDRGGCSVRYALLSDLDDETFAHELLDSTLPRLISAFGHLVLHGGSVAGRAGAVVLVGESGAGKSTMSAALTARGHRLLGDDVAVIVSIDGRFEVRPAGTNLRLYEASAVSTLTEPVLGPPMAHWSDKRLVVPADNGLVTADEPAPLRAVVKLEHGDQAPTLTCLDQGIAFEVLARNNFDLPYATPTAGLELLDRWAPLSAAVPTFELRRRFDLSELTAVCELLTPLLDGDG